MLVNIVRKFNQEFPAFFWKILRWKISIKVRVTWKRYKWLWPTDFLLLICHFCYTVVNSLKNGSKITGRGGGRGIVTDWSKARNLAQLFNWTQWTILGGVPQKIKIIFQNDSNKSFMISVIFSRFFHKFWFQVIAFQRAHTLSMSYSWFNANGIFESKTCGKNVRTILQTSSNISLPPFCKKNGIFCGTLSGIAY